jgi:hypothetical protein
VRLYRSGAVVRQYNLDESKAIKDFLRRTMHSPRYAFARPYLSPFLEKALPEKQCLRVVMNRESEELALGLGPESLAVMEVSGEALADR